VKKFENWSVFDEVTRHTKMCQIFGPPYIERWDAIVTRKNSSWASLNQRTFILSWASALNLSTQNFHYVHIWLQPVGSNPGADTNEANVCSHLTAEDISSWQQYTIVNCLYCRLQSQIR